MKEDSFDRTWKRYYAPIRYFVRCTLSHVSENDVADIVQDIMLKAFRRRNSFNHRWAFSTWIYAIAGNTCRDYLRRQQTRTKGMRLLKSDAYAGSGIETTDPVASEVLRSDLRSMVATFLRELTGADHQILFLHYFEEMSFADISTALDIPEGTAKYRAHMLRRRLKEYLEARHVDAI